MTEREKRIEEMVKDGAECSHIAEWWNCKRCKYSPCGARRTCENLVDADYRKADEVRKETAKEIIKELIGHRFAYYCEDEEYGTKTLLADYVVDKEDVKWLVDKFGVEVEE